MHTRPGRLLAEPATVMDELDRAYAHACRTPPPAVSTALWRP